MSCRTEARVERNTARDPISTCVPLHRLLLKMFEPGGPDLKPQINAGAPHLASEMWVLDDANDRRNY